MRTLGKRLPLLASIVVLGACASGGATSSEPAGAPASASAPVTVPAAASSGGAIYSAAQAERGRATFRAVCAECHYSSEFRGTQFQFSWRRRSVGDFFKEISSTMPEDAPGSLDPSVYLEVVAYVLELNGFPAGEADLPLDATALDQHSMAAPSAGDRER